MSIVTAIGIAAAGREVPGPELEEAFDEIARGTATPAQIAALLVALRVRGETVGEIVSIARSLRRHAVTTEVTDPRTVDVCGTGGSGLDTFNISTSAAFVVAGAGVPVAKHGNRAASSRSGSFDVLEALGVRIDLPIERYGVILREIGIAPLFARSAHPAMRNVAPVRQEIGIRTLMNCLGPLLNPAGVRRQVVGVYARELVRPLAEALRELGAERALVLHGEDGLDELTTTGRSHAALLDEGEVSDLVVDPEKLGFPLASPEDLAGGDPASNARTLRAILEGEGGPRRDVVVLNAAAAIWVGGAADGIAAGLTLAEQSIDSGAALAKLEALKCATAEAA